VGDYYYPTSSNSVVMFGGYAYAAGLAGAFFLDATYGAADATAAVSAGLSY
jgi:hypothetical protein